MGRLILAGVFFVVALGIAILAAYTKTWWFLVVAVIWGYSTLFFAVQFGKKKWEGRIISEEDLPREIYQVVAITMYGQWAVAVLRDKKRQLLVCQSCQADGQFGYFTVTKNDYGEFFVPDDLRMPFQGVLPETPEEGVSVTS